MLGLSKFLHEDPNLANQLGQTKKAKKKQGQPFQPVGKQ